MIGNTLELVVSKDTNPHFWSVDFIGSMDSYTLHEKGKELEKIVHSVEPKILVFSFVNLEYINSQGIGLLFQYSENLKLANKKLVLIGARKNVEDVLNTIGIFETTEHYKTMPEFLKTLENA